ncbi:MAG: DNA-directed RNA polymerase subunit beta [Planctomycetota bacterium]|nr:MAG: DNA-directed RNA polymerase subunit beta [Planctomycetota bacterium]
MPQSTLPQRNFGRVKEILPVPNLVALQVQSFQRFLQEDLQPRERQPIGLEGILREVFPIESFDGRIALEYIEYELAKPRYAPDDCRRLRLTYGTPFKIRVRLRHPDRIIEEDVYLGEIPRMLGGGEFIINGAERVIVSQLHRSPGVDFDVEVSAERHLYRCRIIPERGSWIELQVTKKDIVTVRIDQSGKFPATTLLRAMHPSLGSDAAILRAFYPIDTISVAARGALKEIAHAVAVRSIVDPETGEVIVEGLEEITENQAQAIRDAGIETVDVIREIGDPLILNTLRADADPDAEWSTEEEEARIRHERALLKIYTRLRPGNPPNLAKARELFDEKFFNINKYRLGRVGRFRINRKFGIDVPESVQILRKEDLILCLQYLVDLRAGKGEIDDIDHLGNRRVRTIDELAGEELRKGFLKLRRTVQERMSLQDPETLTPRTVVNSKTISSAIEYFFGRGELSQVVDQTNPLSQLTHERRLSALGPGGLNRKRAGFEVRDVHISHYGRICPIETPEGTNIGLISSLATFATVDTYGFLITPYRRVKKGKVTDEIVWLRADEEDHYTIAPADTPLDANGKMAEKLVMARRRGDFVNVPAREVDFIDVSPKQLVGVSAALIPFLEHDDANRALMGSNMQRQAVPLVQLDPPLVATGMERAVAANSGMVVRAPHDGVVTRVDARRIQIDDDEPIELRKFVGLNERTCQNQRPIVMPGEEVVAGQVIADGAAVEKGELALGRNVLVAFMSYEGYNFEDAILVSHELVEEDAYTSIHIEEFEIEIRETKLGKEEFTRDIPNVSERMLRNLDEDGVVRIGTKVGPGDILVGKVVPKSKSELTPEEKLLHAIFGRMGEDVKNDSLEVPPGVRGIVIDTQRFKRRSYLTEQERAQIKAEVEACKEKYDAMIHKRLAALFADIKRVCGKLPKALDAEGKPTRAISLSAAEGMEFKDLKEYLRPTCVELPKKKGVAPEYTRLVHEALAEIEELDAEKQRRLNHIERGDELPTGVLALVKVYIATKRSLSVGDKMAGRHGNKGVIAKILPKEDMPFLEDGTPVQIVLNPLGVPSRMNVGQILETHLGWAAKILGFQAITPVFDGVPEKEIEALLKQAGLPEDGKVTLYDGRTGKRFDQRVTVGYLYMLKLHHLVDDKIHARATGPYSLITQQPLGGKARFGGQRFGEMEVWALEAYGAANILQELLTVKSDDVEGRTKIYESMVKGENILEPGTPVSFEVLTHEIKGLCLNMELERARPLESPLDPLSSLGA